jgi:hypothetical protein
MLWWLGWSVARRAARVPLAWAVGDGDWLGLAAEWSTASLGMKTRTRIVGSCAPQTCDMSHVIFLLQFYFQIKYSFFASTNIKITQCLLAWSPLVGCTYFQISCAQCTASRDMARTLIIQNDHACTCMDRVDFHNLPQHSVYYFLIKSL